MAVCLVNNRMYVYYIWYGSVQTTQTRDYPMRVDKPTSSYEILMQLVDLFKSHVVERKLYILHLHRFITMRY